MKIAILTPQFWIYDGISKVVSNQALELSEQGHKVTIFAGAANMNPPINIRLEILTIPQGKISQAVYGLIFPLDIYKILKWIPRLKHFDVIYTHRYPMTWLALLSKKIYGNRMVVYHHHFNPPEALISPIERIYAMIRFKLEKWTANKADDAIAISKYSQQQLKNETGLESKVIYNKIDPQKFNRNINGSIIRKKHNLGNAPVVLYVGQILPHKCLHLLIEAYNSIKIQLPDTKLLIIGKHTDMNYFHKIKKMSDNSVIFTGIVHPDEVPNYYAACDVYATASMWEGFDIPLVEAQACGKPVVAFNIGPHSEIMNNSNGCIIVPAGDTSLLAEGILKILRIKK